MEEQANQSATALQSIAAKGEKLKTVGDNITNVGKKFLPVTGGATALGTAADALFEELSCPCISLKKLNKSELRAYDRIIFGGWVMGNMIMERYKREEFIHTCIDFAQGEMIKVSCYLPETYSNLLLQYEDPTGEYFSYFVIYDMSGDNMAVVLKDEMSTEIKW